MKSATLAYHLDAVGLVDFRPTASGGNCFVDRMPDAPDLIVVVTELGGNVDQVGNDEMQTFQIRVRGAADDPTTPRTLAGQIADAIVALASSTPAVLAENTAFASTLVLVEPGLPANMGLDVKDRTEWVLRVSTRSR